jgi:hypothetical protein
MENFILASSTIVAVLSLHLKVAPPKAWILDPFVANRDTTGPRHFSKSESRQRPLHPMASINRKSDGRLGNWPRGVLFPASQVDGQLQMVERVR